MPNPDLDARLNLSRPRPRHKVSRPRWTDY